ncbi:MAG: lytic murein transglycosylase [Geminicoccaceae bacterium]
MIRHSRVWKPIDRIIELDRKQPEGRMTFVEYKRKVISRSRIAKGGNCCAGMRPSSPGSRRRFGVPAEVIVACGASDRALASSRERFPVIDALATLAYDGRREELFTRELISALQILDNGDVDKVNMFGSGPGPWASRSSSPSTFAGYAVDADGDGRRDIWTSLPDVFASMANYLSRIGWDQLRLGAQLQVRARSLPRKSASTTSCHCTRMEAHGASPRRWRSPARRPTSTRW